MINYNIQTIQRNERGEVIRCPECGQVLCVLAELEGHAREVIQCRRCHSYVSIEVESDDIPEY